MDIIIYSKVKITEKVFKLCIQCKLIVKLPITFYCKQVRNNLSNIYSIFIYLNSTQSFKCAFLCIILVNNSRHLCINKCKFYLSFGSSQN